MPSTTYYWDEIDDNVCCEEDENGDITASYTHETGLYGEVIAQKRGEDIRYFNFDGEGNTSELTDEDENVTDTYEYSAFGEEVARTGSTENPFGYKGALGYYSNGDTSDIYVRARVFKPTIGRWHSMDPVGFKESTNRLQYCLGDPIGVVDPSGRWINAGTEVGEPESLVLLSDGNLGGELVSGCRFTGVLQNGSCLAGHANASVTVADLVDFFFAMRVDCFSLIFGPSHPLTTELKGHAYVRTRVSELITDLVNRCAECNNSRGTTVGWRIAGPGDFFLELPGNIHGVLTAAGWPVVNFLGSYHLRLDYVKVDCCNGTAEIRAAVNNSTTAGSLARIPGTNIRIVNTNAKFNQLFEWTEPVSFATNPDCCCDSLESLLEQRKCALPIATPNS